MQATKTNHYFDIQLRDRISNYDMSGTLDKCGKVQRISTRQSFMLKFDGQPYQIPKRHTEQYAD